MLFVFAYVFNYSSLLLVYTSLHRASTNMAKRARCDYPVDIASVKLNIGGQVFGTSRLTIQAFGYLAARLENSNMLYCDKLFADRDPVCFEILLQALRTFPRSPQYAINIFRGGFVFVDTLVITAISGELITQLDTTGHWTIQMVRLRILTILYTDSCGITLVTLGGEIVTDEDHIGVASLTAVVSDQANDTSRELVC